MMAVWKIGPALAAGNTVVIKPSELTPLTTLRMAELAADVRVPPSALDCFPWWWRYRSPIGGRAPRVDSQFEPMRNRGHDRRRHVRY